MIYSKLDTKMISYINNLKDDVTIELYNTKYLNSKILDKVKNDKCIFKIFGGLNDIDFIERYDKRITYSLNEIKQIISEFEKIEANLPKNKLDKIVYIYDFLRKNIIYYPDEENDELIRSLRVLITKHAVCSGYGLVFKEFLDRQNIKCEYVKYFNHIWNRFYFNKKCYEVDLTWDSCVYLKYPSSNLHFFANNLKLNDEHHNKKKYLNYFANDLIKNYKLYTLNFIRDDKSRFKLTLLPIGFKKKYYIYEDDDIKCLVCSDDDFEIICSKMNDSIISSYINCFFTRDRIEKYRSNNYSYLGYGLIENNCFYRKKVQEKDLFINKVEYKNNFVIINYKYFIDEDYNMKEV